MLEAFDFRPSIANLPPQSLDAGEAAAGQTEPAQQAIPKEELALLCEIGILAVVKQRGQDARSIFELLDREQPDNAAGPIGLAMLDIELGDDQKAFSDLRQAIRNRARCVREAKAVLCILLMNFGRLAEAKLLKKEILRGPECGARRLVASYAMTA